MRPQRLTRICYRNNTLLYLTRMMLLILHRVATENSRDLFQHMNRMLRRELYGTLNNGNANE